jgi:pimeloyl-ACP methyl ester carboxylesterase
MMQFTQKRLRDQVGYRIAGSGEPVILLHGFGEDGNIWMDQAKEMASAFTVIVPDLPGTGISAPALAYLPEQRIEAMAEVVKAIAEQEYLGQFSLIGHSMGGYISLAFTEKYAGMLKGFGLVHSTAYADSEEKIHNRKRSIQFIKDHGSNAFLRQMIPGLYGDGYKADNGEQVERHIESSKDIDPESLISYLEMMMKRPDRTKVLSDFENPVLFIMGTEDKTVNLSDSLAQCHVPVESHVHILESSGHMGMKEKSAETTNAMKKFLEHLNEN